MNELVAYNKYFKKELPVMGSYIYGDELRYIYGNGLQELGNICLQRKSKKYQTIILFTGPTGRGKSTAAIKMMQSIKPRWDIRSGYVYSASDLGRILQDKNAELVLIDEGSIVINSKNSMRKDDVHIAQMFDIMRVLGKIVAVCTPNHNGINKYIRDTHIDFMCKCPVVSPIPGYDPRGFLDIYVHKTRDWGEDYYKHVCTTTFDPLGRKTQEKYDEIKMEALKRTMDEIL